MIANKPPAGKLFFPEGIWFPYQRKKQIVCLTAFLFLSYGKVKQATVAKKQVAVMDRQPKNGSLWLSTIRQKGQDGVVSPRKNKANLYKWEVYCDEQGIVRR